MMKSMLGRGIGGFLGVIGSLNERGTISCSIYPAASLASSKPQIDDPIPFTAFARFERLTAEKSLLYCELGGGPTIAK